MTFITNMFKSPAPLKDEHWNNLEIHKALYRNGIITERAKIELRSLSYEERQIITAIRNIAFEKGFSQEVINVTEMEGQRDKELVYAPYDVRVRFAYYQSAYYGHSQAEPSFIVVKSNHPVLILHGNFGLEELQKYAVKIPRYPTFQEWDKNGRRCYRGE